MALSTIIYLANLSNSFALFFGLTAIIIGIYLIIRLITWAPQEQPFNKKHIKNVITVILISSVMSCLLPDKDTMYTMVAVNGIDNIAKTPEADKARKVLNLGLDKIINNLQESK